MTFTADEYQTIEAKLATLHYVPKEPLVRSEAFDTLEGLSRDYPHALEIVGKILESCSDWPANVEIRDAARLVVDEAWEPAQPLHGCPICRNRGYVIVYQLGTLSQGLNYRQRASMQDVSREVYEQLRLRLPEDIPAAIPTRERQFATTAARKCRCGQ